MVVRNLKFSDSYFLISVSETLTSHELRRQVQEVIEVIFQVAPTIRCSVIITLESSGRPSTYLHEAPSLPFVHCLHCWMCILH